MLKPFMKLPLSAVAVVLALAGCASSYTPVVDMKGVDPSQYQQDLSDCRGYADQVDAVENGATDTLIGAVGGAAVGAALGAIGGNAGSGAAMGTAIGGFGGGGAGVASSVQRQKAIMNNCLKGRGYRVLG